MVSLIFRLFEGAKPQRGRKLNIDPSQPFDPYTDRLLDYATIMASKLNKEDWQDYNRLISLHIPRCLNNCWHCYVPKNLYRDADSQGNCIDITAAEILDKFESQRDADMASGKQSNVLRITGGEPFLLPKLILECLDEIKKRNLEKDIFLWTETNLEPFIGKHGKAFMDRAENTELLKEMGTHENFAVHPCFHGLDSSEFKRITACSEHVTLEDQISALERLIDKGIDVYPTIGSNVCNPANLPQFFNLLAKAPHPQLPLRVALIEYYFDYEPVRERLNQENRSGDSVLYSKFASLRIWNQLLLNRFGVGYAVIPRHLVKIGDGCYVSSKEGSSRTPQAENEMIYFFKSSYRRAYHREILDCLAYPDGHIIEVIYNKEHVQNDLFIHMSQNPNQYREKEAVWIYSAYEKRALIPFRKAQIIDVRGGTDLLSIKMKLKDYMARIYDAGEPSQNWRGLYESLHWYIGKQNLPLPPGGKYLLMGESLVSSAFEQMKVNLKQEPKEDIFRQIPLQLSNNTEMEESIFYRIGTDGLKQVTDDVETIYEISAGKSFSITIDYDLPNYEKFNEYLPDDRSLIVEISHPDIKLIGSNIVVFSKYGKEILRFYSENVPTKREVTITLRTLGDEFHAARVVLKIKPLS